MAGEGKCSKIVVTNRTLSRAEALAAEIGATARPMHELEAQLGIADVVVS